MLTDALQVKLRCYMQYFFFCFDDVFIEVEFQADRSFVMRREKELNGKAEAVDVAKNGISNAESKIAELEQQLQKCVAENNELEIKMEETLEDSGLTVYLLVIYIR